MTYQFFRRNWSPRTAILITEISISVQEPRREEKTTAKSKQRSGNCCTKQWKQPNVNSSEATSTRNSNENAKMQANHSRNQNRKTAEVLLKGLESKTSSHVFITSYQNSSNKTNNKSWKIWKPIESWWLIEEILDAQNIVSETLEPKTHI